MTEEFKKQIETQARQAVTELLAEAKLKKGDVFVVGCSSSEIVGGTSARIPVWKPRRPCTRALPQCWLKTASGWPRSAVSI